MVRINTKHLQKLNSYLQQVSATVKLQDITDQSANKKKLIYLLVIIIIIIIIIIIFIVFILIG